MKQSLVIVTLLALITIFGSGLVRSDDPVCFVNTPGIFQFCYFQGFPIANISVQNLINLNIKLTTGFVASLSPPVSPNICHTPNGSYPIDTYIAQAINATQFMPDLFPYSKAAAANITGTDLDNDPIKCAEFMAIDLCARAFRGNYPEPAPICTVDYCNTMFLKNRYCSIANYPLMYQNLTLLPKNLTDCLGPNPQHSVNNTCVLAPMASRIGSWNYNPIFVVVVTEVLKGTLLAFGMLIAFLLVIASLGLIMKQQQKK